MLMIFGELPWFSMSSSPSRKYGRDRPLQVENHFSLGHSQDFF